ncbi:hypothetical protein Trydic_g3329 [Trypoxylus dichotomus]
MGRKIKGRKHRGIRDPEKQRQTKLLSLHDKINRAPSNPDDQQIPKSLSHIINLKEKVQNGIISIKRKRKHKTKKALRPITSHPRGTKTSGVDRDVPFFQQEEDKYGVNIVRNPETGQVEKVTKRKKDELELYVKQIKKERNLKGKKKLKRNAEELKLTKSQKRQLKLKQKKENKILSNVNKFETLEDNVKFGEVVHEPPTLSAPRKIKLGETPRPGRKNLLLKSLIDPNTNTEKLMISQDSRLIGLMQTKTMLG